MSFTFNPTYLPDIVSVGFPKCATSFILRRFQEFEFETLGKNEFIFKDMEKFQSEIKIARDSGRIVAIKNPRYIYNRNYMELLMKANCKLIVSVRNPVRWLKSFYNYRREELKSGKKPKKFEKEYSFNEIVFEQRNWWNVSVENGMMAKIIKDNLLSSQYYNSKNVLFIIQEEFEMRFQTVYQELLDFICVPRHVTVKRKFQLEFDKPQRYSNFEGEDYEESLRKIYKKEIHELISVIDDNTSKDLKSIWDEYYDFSS